MTPEERDALNDIRESLKELTPMPSLMTRLESRLIQIDDRQRTMEIEGARKQEEQDQLISTNGTEVAKAFVAIGHVRGDLSGHVEGHWKWIVGTVTLVLGLAGVIIACASWMQNGETSRPDGIATGRWSDARPHYQLAGDANAATRQKVVKTQQQSRQSGGNRP